MIELKGVNKSYPRGRETIRAAAELSLTVAAGEFVVITGPSGSGKTTLLNLIGGMTRPDSGEIRVAQKNLWALSDRELSRFRASTIGFMFQCPSMLGNLSALENLRLPLYFAGKPDDETAARSLLAEVGLADRADALSHELSAGQQRRVVLARALITHPQLLLCDEPTGDLDPQTETAIMAILSRAHQNGATVLLTTHHLAPCEFAARRLVIEDGRLNDRSA